MQIEVKLKTNPYKVYIDEPLNLHFDSRVAILSNAKISSLHLSSLLSRLECDEPLIITVKDGEAYKNFNTIEEILNQMFHARLDRKSVLISFGGGVISDMGGFAASIYQRGIRFINIPTTLLACVDASVGGKTGINNAFGKNLIGAFHQPIAVHCRSEFLRTLGARELAAGMAEVIKMAVIFDARFLEFLEGIDAHGLLNATCEDEIFTRIIAKSVELKAAVVAEDERESGARMFLNYGHTFAHIIENETGYEKYLHGEAVALGMMMANRLALNLGLLSEAEVGRVGGLLRKFKLPLDHRIKNVQSFYEAFFLDKKTQNSRLNFILPCGLGKGVIRDDVSKDELLRLLEGFA